MDRVLGVCQATPVAAVDDEDGEWEGCAIESVQGFPRALLTFKAKIEDIRTVTKDKLAYASYVHATQAC